MRAGASLTHMIDVQIHCVFVSLPIVRNAKASGSVRGSRGIELSKA
jgi:hypothetical protein